MNQANRADFGSGARAGLLRAGASACGCRWGEAGRRQGKSPHVLSEEASVHVPGEVVLVLTAVQSALLHSMTEGDPKIRANMATLVSSG
jgi:hypothetical protein